jgi:hypothetical protein
MHTPCQVRERFIRSFLRRVPVGLHGSEPLDDHLSPHSHLPLEG